MRRSGRSGRSQPPGRSSAGQPMVPVLWLARTRTVVQKADSASAKLRYMMRLLRACGDQAIGRTGTAALIARPAKARAATTETAAR